MADLVERADKLLQGEYAAPVGPDPLPTAHRELVEEVRQTGLPSVSLRPPQVIVAAPDRRGLFSSVAGALALNGMDVRAANVGGGDGVAVEVFTVEVARGTWPDTAKLRGGPGRRPVRPPRSGRAPVRARARLPAAPAVRRPPSGERRHASTTRPRPRRRCSRCGRPTKSASCTGSPGRSSRPTSTSSRPGSPRSVKWWLTPSTCVSRPGPR